MKISISYFAQVRNFKRPNIIPISTTGGGWPFWMYQAYKQKKGSCFLNENNIMIGIWEDKFSCLDLFDHLDEKCGEKPCKYLNKVPHCKFMDAYLEHLRSIDINYLLSEFNRVAEDVRKITNYIGEPEIVLMVYEPKTCLCAERPVIQQYFKENGIVVSEWLA